MTNSPLFGAIRLLPVSFASLAEKAAWLTKNPKYREVAKLGLTKTQPGEVSVLLAEHADAIACLSAMVQANAANHKARAAYAKACQTAGRTEAESLV